MNWLLFINYLFSTLKFFLWFTLARQWESFYISLVRLTQAKSFSMCNRTRWCSLKIQASAVVHAIDMLKINLYPLFAFERNVVIENIIYIPILSLIFCFPKLETLGIQGTNKHILILVLPHWLSFLPKLRNRQIKVWKKWK